jgi:hypothetical protein
MTNQQALGSQPKPPNDGLQLWRAISIQAEGTRLLEKHAIAPSAARLCWAAALHTSEPALIPGIIKNKIAFRVE